MADLFHDDRSMSSGSEARYRAIVDTAVDAIVVIDEFGMIHAFNRAAEDLFGYDADEVVGRNVKMLLPEPTAQVGCRATREWRIVGRGREISGLRRDGSILPLELSVAQWSLGSEHFFTNTMRDVTDRKLADEHQQLLVNELNHRVKNTLATVQAVAGQSLRNASSVEEADSVLTSRLLALAQAHDVLTREDWHGATLADVVHAALAPHGERRRFDIAGPNVRLTPKASLALSMVLHELFTNALKYGALSNDTGRVSICWSTTMANPRRLDLRWAERDGPPVGPPGRKGFGTRLIETGLARELHGHAALDYQPSGLICTISAEMAPALSSCLSPAA